MNDLLWYLSGAAMHGNGHGNGYGYGNGYGKCAQTF